MNIPVCFIHKGNHPALLYAIKQALHYGNEVVLIGDEKNKSLANMDKVTYCDISTLESEALFYLRKHYVHLATSDCDGDYDFELFCIERWFLLNEYMRRVQLETIIYLDSDVLLYMNTDTLRTIMTTYGTSYRAGYEYANPTECLEGGLGLGAISFWKEEILGVFIDFILNMYQHNVKRLENIYDNMILNREEKIEGWGYRVSDMTFFYLFAKDNSGKIVNFSEYKNEIILLGMGDNGNRYQTKSVSKYSFMGTPLSWIRKRHKLEKNDIFTDIQYQDTSIHFTPFVKDDVRKFDVLAIHFWSWTKMHMYGYVSYEGIQRKKGRILLAYWKKEFPYMLKYELIYGMLKYSGLLFFYKMFCRILNKK